MGSACCKGEADHSVETPSPSVVQAMLNAGLITCTKAAERAGSGSGESVEFLNDILAAVQPYLRPALRKMLKELVEPMFKDMLPVPLKDLHFTKIDLGTVPFRLSNVNATQMHNGKILDPATAKERNTDPNDPPDEDIDAVKLDLDLHWDGKMDVELMCRIAMVPVHLGIEHVKFKGRVSILLRPMIKQIPLVSAMQISLMNPPDLDLDFTGVANALDIGLVDDSIRNIIQTVVGGLLVLPNRMLIKMDPMNDLYRSYLDPTGFIRVHIISGEGFKSAGFFGGGVPDLYCKVTFGANPAWTTSVENNKTEPQWNEAHDFLYSDPDQLIEVEVLDSDVGNDKSLGVAKLTVGELVSKGNTATLELKPKSKNQKKKNEDVRETITIGCDIMNLTTDGKSLSAKGEAAKKSGVQKLHNGLLTIMVAKALGLTGEREELQTQVIVECNGNKFYSMMVGDFPGIDVNNPCFDGVFRVMLTPEIIEEAPEVKFTLNNKGKAIDTFTVAFKDILAAKDPNAGDAKLRDPSKNMSLEKEFAVTSGGKLLTRSYILGTLAPETSCLVPSESAK